MCVMKVIEAIGRNADPDKDLAMWIFAAVMTVSFLWAILCACKTHRDGVRGRCTF